MSEEIKLVKKSNWLDKQRENKFIKSFIRKNIIPLEVNQPANLNENKNYYFKFLEILGFKNLNVKGNIIFAKFPNGWKYKQLRPNEKFIYLLDDKNRKRATVFISVFMSEENQGDSVFAIKKFITFINWLPRYMIRFEDNEGKIKAVIVDNANDEIIYETKVKVIKLKDEEKNDEHKYHLLKKNIYDSLENECRTFLNLNYPKYNNILEYWENKNYVYDDN